MDAIHSLSGARFELFSATPPWFFDESIPGLYRLRDTVTDVGFRQRSALAYDLQATVAALDALMPFDEAWLESLASTVVEAGCAAVLCDIAPLGVAVAERAGLPSLLVENFTWPWLYEPLLSEAPRLRAVSAEMEAWFARATWHVQTEPLCWVDDAADLRVPPIGRAARRARADIRRDLGVGDDASVVLLTMGGVPEDLPFLDRLEALDGIDFVVTGAPRTHIRRNLHLFSNEERLYLPDLVRASDAVVAKLGYSTVAEVWREGRPLAYVTRSDFRETEPVRRWVQGELSGFEISTPEFATGTWIARLPELLGRPGTDVHAEGGAHRVARFLLDRLEV